MIPAMIPPKNDMLTLASIVAAVAVRTQILDEADYISHRTNTFGKGMNAIILPPAMGR